MAVLLFADSFKEVLKAFRSVRYVKFVQYLSSRKPYGNAVVVAAYVNADAYAGGRCHFCVSVRCQSREISSVDLVYLQSHIRGLIGTIPFDPVG